MGGLGTTNVALANATPRAGAATRPMRDNELKRSAHQQHCRDKNRVNGVARRRRRWVKGASRMRAATFMPRGSRWTAKRPRPEDCLHSTISSDLIPELARKLSAASPSAKKPGFARPNPDCRHSRDIPRAAPQSRHGQDGAGFSVAIADMAAVAMEISDDRPSGARREVPREQRQAVVRPELDLAHPGHREIGQRRPRRTRVIKAARRCSKKRPATMPP